MSISRRGFLETGAMVAAASATAGFATVAAASTPNIDKTKSDVIARLSLADAKFLVGSAFLVHVPSGNTTLRCVEVKAVGPQSESTSDPNQAFAMRFQLEGDKPLKEGTYTFEHSFLGEFRLFVAPSGHSAGSRFYIAIINHQTA